LPDDTTVAFGGKIGNQDGDMGSGSGGHLTIPAWKSLGRQENPYLLAVALFTSRRDRPVH
jgi:hypothetical protein